LYDAGQPAELSLEYSDALAMFGASVRRNPDGDLIRYFGGGITARELDELSDAFAVALAGLGVVPGDRVALYLQNVPQFVIGLLATWKAGGVAVPVNPMNRARELDAVLRDSGARVLVCLEGLYRDVAAEVAREMAGATGVRSARRTSRRSSPTPSRTGKPVPLYDYCCPQGLRHYRPAQGGHEHPRQRGVQFPGLPPVV
jgi:long-chain acyl-CoA synthetase